MKRSQLVLKRCLPVLADFEQGQGFVTRFDLVLPTVNRFDGRQNVRARRKTFAHQLVRNPVRDFGVRKSAQRNKDFFSHVLRGHERFPAASPSAAEDDVTVVYDCSLSGRYGTLKVMQADMCTIVLERRNCCTRPGMVITDLDCRFE